jgi:glyoxylase-like metal-dependent hydrolase (beta-lactamase superfamily II)
MKHPSTLIAAAAILAAASGATPALAQAGKSGIERLYILDCGQGRAPDQSRWSPGVNVGQPMDIVDQCYLIKHSQGWMLWDTGLTDQLAAKPDGETSPSSGLTWRRPKTLAAQLQQLNVKPSDIKFVAVSHTHPDHIGNVELFPQQMLLVQKAEYEWPGEGGRPRFVPGHPVTKLEGDHDVFGDGSVTIISTPGHTPGHQVLLVKLPKFGAVLLSGDAVHFRDNFDNRRVPGGNVDKDKTVASMNRMAEIMVKEKAQLWINHDKAQADTLKHAPDFYE